MKQQISIEDQIKEGIRRGFWNPILMFIGIVGCVILFVWLIIFIFIPDYDTTAAPRSCFPLENVYCKIISGNFTFEFTEYTYNICGYIEAEKKFEYYKIVAGERLKEYYKTQGLDYKIKRLECE